MPSTQQNTRNTVYRNLAVGICLLALSGCSLFGKAASSADAAEPELAAAPKAPQVRSQMPSPQGVNPQNSNPKGIMAKGGLTASSRYVDPAVSASAHPTPQTAPAKLMTGMMPKSMHAGATPALTAAAFPPAPAPAQNAVPDQTAPVSIAGLAVQPTGIRASSVSIFSSTVPAPAAYAPSPQTTAAVPVYASAAPTGVGAGVPRQPLRTGAACGTTAIGRPASC